MILIAYLVMNVIRIIIIILFMTVKVNYYIGTKNFEIFTISGPNKVGFLGWIIIIFYTI